MDGFGFVKVDEDEQSQQEQMSAKRPLTRKSEATFTTPARESQDKNFSKGPNSSHMPFTPTHPWHPT